MIIYLYGPDTARLQETLSQMKQKFTTERDPQGMNLVELRVGECSEADMLEQLYASPFLAEKRMLVLRDLISDGSKELHSTLSEHLNDEKLPSDIIVIITDGEVKPRAKASKELQAYLESQQYSQSFAQLEGRALQDWVLREVTSKGSSIDRDAAVLLAQHTWDDPLQLSHVIDQLIAYASGRSITTTDTEIFVPKESEDDIFALVDLVVMGKTDLAFERIRDQYRLGKDPHYIFSMLLRQYRIMLDISDVLERGSGLNAKAMGLHPFVLKKTQSLVGRMNRGDILARYQQLVQIDRSIKTGVADPSILIDLFVSQHS